jgi:hypothetical protein
MSEYTVDPHGVFLEVPYPLLGAWTSGGYTWPELLAADGLPAVVAARLTQTNVEYCARVVKIYASLDAYCAATGETRCPPGRAWLVPSRTAAGPVALLTGVMHTPMRTGQRGRMRW